MSCRSDAVPEVGRAVHSGTGPVAACQNQFRSPDCSEHCPLASAMISRARIPHDTDRNKDDKSSIARIAILRIVKVMTVRIRINTTAIVVMTKAVVSLPISILVKLIATMTVMIHVITIRIVTTIFSATLTTIISILVVETKSWTVNQISNDHSNINKQYQ